MERQGDRAGGHGWPSKPLHPATCCLGTAATGCAPRRRTRLEQGIDSLYHAILSLWLLHLTSYGPAIKQWSRGEAPRTLQNDQMPFQYAMSCDLFSATNTTSPPEATQELFGGVETVVGTRDAGSPAGCSTGTCQACFWRSCGTRTCQACFWRSCGTRI